MYGQQKRLSAKDSLLLINISLNLNEKSKGITGNKTDFYMLYLLLE